MNAHEITTELLQAQSLAKAVQSPENKAILDACLRKVSLAMQGSPTWAGVAAFALLTEAIRLEAEKASKVVIDGTTHN